jgi:hypothetical protein
MRRLATFFAAGVLLCSGAAAQPRADGKPDLQGIWQAPGTAAADLQDHGASMGIPAGRGVIVDPPDGKIPYQPWAAQKRKENFENRAAADPLGKCFLAGVPRIMYLPFPFQIFETPQAIAIAYEYDHATRTIYMDGSKHLEDIDFWMGDSRGHWEGDTLVVEVADLNDQTWLDAAGDFHSDQMKLIERYTRTGSDTLQYEVTIEDPKVYTRPWKISMPLYRHAEKDFQLYEYECHDYLEEAQKRQAPKKEGKP